MDGRIARIVGVLALAAAAAPLQAMEEGWSFEVAMGQASFTNVSTADLDLLPARYFAQSNLRIESLQSTVKTKDRSYAFTTSYRFNRNLAMETSYFRLGAFQYASTSIVDAGSADVPAQFNFTFRAKGATLGVAASWPLGEIFEVRARGGISTSDTRVRRTAIIQSSTVRDSASASSQDLYMGAGVGATLRETWRVGVDWMRHRNIGQTSYTYSATADNTMLSVAFLY